VWVGRDPEAENTRSQDSISSTSICANGQLVDICYLGADILDKRWGIGIEVGAAKEGSEFVFLLLNADE